MVSFIYTKAMLPLKRQTSCPKTLINCARARVRTCVSNDRERERQRQRQTDSQTDRETERALSSPTKETLSGFIFNFKTLLFNKTEDLPSFPFHAAVFLCRMSLFIILSSCVYIVCLYIIHSRVRASLCVFALRVISPSSCCSIEIQTL